MIDHIIYGGTVILTIVAVTAIPYIIGYKQGRAKAKEIALQTLAVLLEEAEQASKSSREKLRKEKKKAAQTYYEKKREELGLSKGF
jgi:hypothetical protein